MHREEELLRALLDYRRLLFRRFRLLQRGDLDQALILSSDLEETERRLPGLVEKAEPFQPVSDRLARLAVQCDFWIRRTYDTFEGMKRQMEGELFRESADLKIKKFLQKMFPPEP